MLTGCNVGCGEVCRKDPHPASAIGNISAKSIIFGLCICKFSCPVGVQVCGFLLCVFLAPQLVWSRRVRRSEPALFLMALIVNTGMWLERFVIVISSLNRDFMPSAWHFYHPTWNDYSVLFGSLGLFATAFYLFVRFVPLMAAFELKELWVKKGRPA